MHHAEEGSRESVDAGCRRLTASWIREKATASSSSGRNGGGAGVSAARQQGGGGVGGGRGVGRGGREAGGSIEDGGGEGSLQLCEFFEGLESSGAEALLPPGASFKCHLS